jgi:ubiquinone/menaquinone biosynthesis C-methylase UbiE
LFLSRRLIKPEVLDHLPPEEARPNLADLVRINRYFGGHSVIRYTLEQVADGESCFSLLDIGCASGDTARLVLTEYPQAKITCLDRNWVNMEIAPYPKVMADAFELPFSAASFDFVLCSLFLHHFSDEQVIGLLGQFYHVARKALLICDLERQIIPYLFLPATKLVLGWNRVTVHDGIRSVRASFREAELVELAERAGVRKAQSQTHRPAFRISVIARK